MTSKWMYPVVFLAGLIPAGGDRGISTARGDSLRYENTVTVFTNQTHGSGTFSLPRFDPSRGILTGVNLVMVVISSGGGVQVENLSYSPITTPVWWGATVEVKPVDSPSIFLDEGSAGVSSTAYRQDTVLLSKNDNVLWSGFDCVTKTGGTCSVSKSREWSSPSVPGDFRGTGDLLFDYTGVLSGGTFPASSNFRKRIPSGATGSATFIARITYQYTVPEIGSSAMVIMGGLGLLRRRRRKE